MGLMKTYPIGGAAVALVAGGALTAWGVQAAAPAAQESRIGELDAAWVKAVESKDLDKIVGFYAPDGSMMADRAPIATGTAAIRGAWQHVLATPGFKLTFTPTRIDVSKSGDLASDVGTFTESEADAGGKVTTTVGKYVVVWKKQPDGHWRVTADIFNSDS